MAQETTVTIETAFQIDLEVPNRMKRNVTLEKAAQYILILAALQTVSIFSCARQSAEVYTVMPAIPPPETIAFDHYKVLVESGIYSLSWMTSYPVSTCWKWRVLGESEWTDRIGEPPNLSTTHVATLPIWMEDRTLEIMPHGFDITDVDHVGDIIEVWIPGI